MNLYVKLEVVLGAALPMALEFVSRTLLEMVLEVLMVPHLAILQEVLGVILILLRAI